MSIISHDNPASNPSALTDYNDLLSINDLSQIFTVSKNTIYKEVKAGKFGSPIQIGRAYKIPKAFIIQKFFYDYK